MWTKMKPAHPCCARQGSVCVSLVIGPCSISSSASELCDFVVAFLKFFWYPLPNWDTGQTNHALIYNWENESTEKVIDLFGVTQHVRNRAMIRALNLWDSAHYRVLGAFSYHSGAAINGFPGQTPSLRTACLLYGGQVPGAQRPFEPHLKSCSDQLSE